MITMTPTDIRRYDAAFELRKQRARVARAFAWFLALWAVLSSACAPRATATRSAAPAAAPAPLASPASLDPQDRPTATDPAVHMGTLANGLSYYVMKQQKPE